MTAALAATAVQRTGAEVDAAEVDRHLGALVNPVPTRRWLAAGLVAVGVTAAVLLAAPGPGFTALQRWFAPLGTTAWPARVALDAPTLPAVLPVDAPAGLRVSVTRGARSGLRVWAHHRFEDGPGGAELMTAQRSGDASTATDFRLNWEPPTTAVRALQTGSTEALHAQVWFTAGDGVTAPPGCGVGGAAAAGGRLGAVAGARLRRGAGAAPDTQPRPGGRHALGPRGVAGGAAADF